MIASKLKTGVLPALVAGLTRRRADFPALVGCPEDDPKADLKAASLVAQALRLEKPPAPARFDAVPPSTGRRQLLPEPLREPFLRLFAPGKLAAPLQEQLAAGMALTLERLFMAPHPYDFHRLEPFLRAHSERLGADVQAWLDRDRPREARHSFLDVPAPTDETWTEAAPAARQRYVAERRLADPAAARALVEAVWAQEAADVRLRLLGALRTRLGVEDRPFLEGLAADRAPKVRDLAARLLSVLPGPDGERPAHREALARISRSTEGLLRKRTVVSLDLPATVRKDAWTAWVIQIFREIEIEALAERLGLPAEEAMAAAASDLPLLGALTLMAARSGRMDLVASLGRSSGVPLALLCAGAFADVDMAQATARDLAEALVPPGAPLSDVVLLTVLERLHAITLGPVGEALFDRLAAEAGPRLGPEGGYEPPAIVLVLALLAPASRREALRTLAAGFDIGGPIIAWLHLVDQLEEASTHE